MLVVVYLINQKKNLIIPQQWIFGLSQEKLNNLGKVSYRNQRIYWTNRGQNSDGIPDETIMPNFHLPLSNIFPPQADETCYIARVKRYCCECCCKTNFFDFIS